jgi:hypothetical protein
MNSRKFSIKAALFSLTVVLSASSFYFINLRNSGVETSFAAPIALPTCPPDGCCPGGCNPPEPSPPPAPAINLTGKWKANDGGTYYLRQVGNQVWWYGEYTPTSPPWSNVYRGTIVNGTEIWGSWADVPKGYILGSGDMKLRIESKNRIVAISKTGSGFGGSIWTR